MSAAIQGMPTRPGRYWFRSPDGRFGIALVKWSPVYAFAPRPSKLEVRSTVLMDTEPDDVANGWSSMGGVERSPDGWVFYEAEPPPEFAFPEVTQVRPTVSEEEIAAERAREEERRRKAEVTQRRSAARRTATRKALADEGATVYECGCGEVYGGEELGTTRSCPHCAEEFFVEPGDERNCPSCNRPFTSLVDEHVTPCCNEVLS